MNRHFRFLLPLSLLLLLCFTSSAQQGVKLQMLTPPPPDVAALGKFGLVPVDNFTGVPSISIPVYTIQEGTLEFPVSLQYHAGGIKVKEDASEVGLGWALSAGGSIVSTVRGRPDLVGGFFNSYSSMPDPPNVIANIKSPSYSLTNWYYQWGNEFNNMGDEPGLGFIFSGLKLSQDGAAKEYYRYFTVGYDGTAPDFASDLYTITIGDRSFKFIFDNDFKPTVIGDGALKIEWYFNGTYPDWKVTDETGTAYFFSQRQFSYTNSVDPPNNGNSSDLNTWHLTRIVSPTYGEIKFKYLYSRNDFTSTLPNISETYLVGNPSTHTQQETDKIGASYTMYERLNIDSIQFSTGYMKFSYDPVRLDLRGARRLQAIEVRDNADRLVKKTLLDNNYYFTASSDNNYYPTFINLSSFTSDNNTKRLKLNGVSEVNITDTANSRKYTFTYNEQLNLPVKLSFSIDHWGYYNGVTNTQLVPPTSLFLSSSPTSLEFSGANRNADPAYMQANMLTSVQYPTGGTTSFTYETNQFQRTETVVTYQHALSELYKAKGSATVNTSGFINANGDFTVSSDWIGKKMEIASIVSRDNSYPSNYEMDIIVKRNGSFLKRISTIPPSGSGMVIDSSIILESGTYNISFDASTTDFFNSYEIRRQVYVLKVTSTSQQVLKTIYSGGLRTSRIRNVDPVSGNVNTKLYTYINGTQDDLPVYESAEGYDPLGAGTGNYFRYRYGQSIYPFSDGRNAPYFGYQKVEIQDVDGNNNANGLSQYNYSTAGSININTMMRYNSVGDHLMIVNPIMAPIPDIASGFRGKLMSEKHYKLVNGTQIPVSSTDYYYTRDNATIIWQMLFNQGLSTFLNSGFNNEQNFRIYAHHFPVCVTRNMLSRKEYSEYDASGNVNLSQFERYAYDNVNGHYQLISKTTQDSKGDTINSYYKYPQDYGDLSSVSNLDQDAQGIRLLQQTHVVTPIETYNERISSTSTDRKYWGGQISIYNNNLPTTKQILALETATPLNAFTPSTVSNGVFNRNNLYTSRIRFPQYDANGRLLTQKKENDLSLSYIWDYNYMRPVAEVMNSEQSDIAYTSFETDGKGNWVFTGTSLVDATAPTGNKCYSLGANITRSGLNTGLTYIVSYWKKSGTVTINGTTGTAGVTANGWTYYQHRINNPSGGLITVSGTSGIIDELRLYPQNAQMNTYTYDPLLGVTSKCNNRNEIVYYEYDGLMRLKLIRDKDRKILKVYDYQYQKPITQ